MRSCLSCLSVSDQLYRCKIFIPSYSFENWWVYYHMLLITWKSQPFELCFLCQSEWVLWVFNMTRVPLSKRTPFLPSPRALSCRFLEPDIWEEPACSYRKWVNSFSSPGRQRAGYPWLENSATILTAFTPIRAGLNSKLRVTQNPDWSIALRFLLSKEIISSWYPVFQCRGVYASE